MVCIYICVYIYISPRLWKLIISLKITSLYSISESFQAYTSTHCRSLAFSAAFPSRSLPLSHTFLSLSLSFTLIYLLSPIFLLIFSIITTKAFKLKKTMLFSSQSSYSLTQSNSDTKRCSQLL